MSNLRERDYLIIIFVLALLARLVLLGAVGFEEPTKDGVLYDTIGQNLLAGRGFSSESYAGGQFFLQPPGYPLFLAFAYFLFGHNYIAVGLLQALMGALTCVVFYHLARKVFDQTITVRAFGLVIAVWPEYIQIVNRMYAEALFLFLLALFMLLAVKAIRGEDPRWYLLAGLCLGLATLVRPVALLFPGFLLLGLLFLYPNKVEAFKHVAVFTVAMVLVIVPWSTRNYIRLHTFIPISTGSGGLLWASSYAPLDGEWSPQTLEAMKGIIGDESRFTPEADRKLTAAAISNIAAYPGFYLRTSLERLAGFWLTPIASGVFAERIGSETLRLGFRIVLYLFQGTLVLLSIVGIWMSRRNTVLLPVWVLLVSVSLMHSLTVFDKRHRLPVMAYAVMFAVYACWELYQRWVQPVLQHIDRQDEKRHVR